jgi:glucose-6-phosphate 1-dehydrogenase
VLVGVREPPPRPGPVVKRQELEHREADDEGDRGDGPGCGNGYEELFHAALIGDRVFFTDQKTIEEEWRIIQPLLDHVPRIRPYREGSWGPGAAHKLPELHGGWRRPWTSSA